MSDSDAMPDPIDEAYVEAEAVLSDEAARDARRARVLAAVAGQGAATPAARPPLWRRGGWLVAACVSGLAVFVAVQVYRPPVSPPPVKPLPAPAAPAPATRGTTIAPAPVQKPAPPTEVAQRAAAKTQAAPSPVVAPSPVPPVAPPPEAARPAATVDEPAPPPPPPPADSATEQAAPAKAASPPQSPSGGVDSLNVGEIVVTAEKRQAPRSVPATIAGLASRMRDLADPAARLRAAAAAGRTSEVEALLKHGAPVDAADADGDTALMKSVQADHPAVAALLRRYGASLDQQNHAGESARDMARDEGDADLNRALGVER